MEKQANRAFDALGFLQLAGKRIMEYGGETFRVEETMQRMGCAFGLEDVESFAVPSGVFVSFRDEHGQVQSGVCRVRRKGTDLKKVDEVNRISRMLVAGEITKGEAYARLQQIEREKPFPTGIPRLLAGGLCAGGFAVMFQGGVQDAVLAFAVGFLVQLFSDFMDSRRMQSMVTILMGAFFSALVPTLVHDLIGGIHLEATVAGTLMPMLPGLAMTNAVQDTVREDMVSSVSHFAQAVITAALVAGGALLGSGLMRLLEGGSI